jgi:hypothetical protein
VSGARLEGFSYALSGGWERLGVLQEDPGVGTAQSNSPTSNAVERDGGETVATPVHHPRHKARRQRPHDSAALRFAQWLWDQSRIGPDGYFGSGG